MPAGENVVPGRQGFQTTERAAAELADIDLADAHAEPDDQWAASDVPPEDIEAWRDGGFDAVAADAWMFESFGARDAARWSDAGFDPATARAWADRRIEAATAAKAMALGVASPIAAADFIEARAAVDEIKPWCDALEAALDIEPEYAGSAYADWAAYSRFSLDEMREWAAAGFTHAADARDWRRYRCTPAQAKAWEAANFGAAESAEWRALGFAPAQADYFATRGLNAQAAREELLDPRSPVPGAA